MAGVVKPQAVSPDRATAIRLLQGFAADPDARRHLVRGYRADEIFAGARRRNRGGSIVGKSPGSNQR